MTAQMVLGMVVVQLFLSALRVVESWCWFVGALAARQDDTLAWLWFSEGPAR